MTLYYLFCHLVRVISTLFDFFPCLVYFPHCYFFFLYFVFFMTLPYGDVCDERASSWRLRGLSRLLWYLSFLGPGRVWYTDILRALVFLPWGKGPPGFVFFSFFFFSFWERKIITTDNGTRIQEQMPLFRLLV